MLVAVERRSRGWPRGRALLRRRDPRQHAGSIALPLVIAAYIALAAAARPHLAAVLVLVCAAVVVAPWMVRNDVQVGCFAITTDGRALWKANNVNTYTTLAAGKWIDDVPQPASFPPTPEFAADEWTGRPQADPDRRVRADAQVRAPDRSSSGATTRARRRS